MCRPLARARARRPAASRASRFSTPLFRASGRATTRDASISASCVASRRLAPPAREMGRPPSSELRRRERWRERRQQSEFDRRRRDALASFARKKTIEKMQKLGIEYAADMMPREGVAARRQLRTNREPLTERIAAFGGGGVDGRAGASLSSAREGPLAIVDVAVRRRPHTSTRMLEVCLVDAGRRAVAARRWLDAETFVEGRGFARRYTTTTTPRDRVRAVRTIISSLVAAVSDRDAFDFSLTHAERSLYIGNADVAGVIREDHENEHISARYDEAKDLSPRIPIGVAFCDGTTSDCTCGELARLRRSLPRLSRPTPGAAQTRKKKVAFELCAGTCNVSVALSRVVDVVIAIDVVDHRSAAAKANKKIVFIKSRVEDWIEHLSQIIDKANYEVVFVWASPDCKKYSKLLNAYYARKSADEKEHEQSIADLLVRECVNFIQVTGTRRWMLENCAGALRTRLEVWSWVDDYVRHETSQCQCGRDDQKNTDLYMNKLLFRVAARFLPNKCAKNDPCEQLRVATKHRKTTQDIRTSREKAAITMGLAKLVAQILEESLRIDEDCDGDDDADDESAYEILSTDAFEIGSRIRVLGAGATDDWFAEVTQVFAETKSLEVRYLIQASSGRFEYESDEFELVDFDSVTEVNAPSSRLSTS